MDNTQAGLKSLGYVQVLAAAATALTIPAGTMLIRIIPEAQAVRWRDDGVAPTAAVGQPLAVGQELIYVGAAMAALQFIEQAASTKLNVTFYGV